MKVKPLSTDRQQFGDAQVINKLFEKCSFLLMAVKKTELSNLKLSKKSCYFSGLSTLPDSQTLLFLHWDLKSFIQIRHHNSLSIYKVLVDYATVL